MDYVVVIPRDQCRVVNPENLFRDSWSARDNAKQLKRLIQQFNQKRHASCWSVFGAIKKDERLYIPPTCNL